MRRIRGNSLADDPGLAMIPSADRRIRPETGGRGWRNG
ncbi:hypothetical protein X739_08900 [Mesorhizobium sp. LNHC220B00]|nr:hypothetical protein X739_08900 [Mesorhizobium sp. LNHC220B00]